MSPLKRSLKYVKFVWSCGCNCLFMSCLPSQSEQWQRESTWILKYYTKHKIRHPCSYKLNKIRNTDGTHTKDNIQCMIVFYFLFYYYQQQLYFVFCFDTNSIMHCGSLDYTYIKCHIVWLHFQLWCSHYTPEYMQEAILTDVHSISKFRLVLIWYNLYEVNQCVIFIKLWIS